MVRIEIGGLRLLVDSFLDSEGVDEAAARLDARLTDAGGGNSGEGADNGDGD